MLCVNINVDKCCVAHGPTFFISFHWCSLILSVFIENIWYVICLLLYDIIAGNVRDMKVSKSENMLATASADGTVRVWGLATDEVIHVLKLPRGKLQYS